MFEMMCFKFLRLCASVMTCHLRRVLSASEGICTISFIFVLFCDFIRICHKIFYSILCGPLYKTNEELQALFVYKFHVMLGLISTSFIAFSLDCVEIILSVSLERLKWLIIKLAASRLLHYDTSVIM